VSGRASIRAYKGVRSDCAAVGRGLTDNHARQSGIPKISGYAGIRSSTTPRKPIYYEMKGPYTVDEALLERSTGLVGSGRSKS